jgi:hypothetical protein
MTLGRLVMGLFIWFVVLPILSVLAYCTFWTAVGNGENKAHTTPTQTCISHTAPAPQKARCTGEKHSHK